MKENQYTYFSDNTTTKHKQKYIVRSLHMVTGKHPLGKHCLVHRNNFPLIDEWVLDWIKVATQLYPKRKVCFYFPAIEN